MATVSCDLGQGGKQVRQRLFPPIDFAALQAAAAVAGSGMDAPLDARGNALSSRGAHTGGSLRGTYASFFFIDDPIAGAELGRQRTCRARSRSSP